MKRDITRLGAGILLALSLISCSGGATTPASSGVSTPPAATAADADIKDGKTLFLTFCAKCHGATGIGDGPSVGSLRTPGGLNLQIVGDKSDKELYTTISAGKGSDMPPWELRLTKEQREELVKYIRTLAKK